jgi:hypothetical protein
MSKNLQIQTSFDIIKNNNHNIHSDLTDYLSISKIDTNSNNKNTIENTINETPSTRFKIKKEILLNNKILRPQSAKISRNFKTLNKIKYNNNLPKVQLTNNYITLHNSRKKYLIDNDKELFNIFYFNTLSNFNNKYDVTFESKKKKKRKDVRKYFDNIKKNGFNDNIKYISRNEKKVLIKKEPIIENIINKDKIKNSFFITDYHNYFKFNEKNNYIKNFKKSENKVIKNDNFQNLINKIIKERAYFKNNIRVFSLKIT